MSIDIRIDTDQVREVAAMFNQAAQSLDDTNNACGTIAGQMEDGALQGTAGELFAEGLRGTLASRINKLQAKLYEISSDLYRAADIHDEAEQKSASGYS